MSIADVLQRVARTGPTGWGVAADTVDLAAMCACTPALWQPLVRDVAGERVYERLFPEATGGRAAQAWVITWAPGTSIDLHDHGDAGAAVAVVRGELTEWHTQRQEPGPLERRDLPAGSIVELAADHLHELRNDGPRPAVSIHVYSSPLDRMRFYEAVAVYRPIDAAA